jgi:1-deoxy-D-xylulose-5-phosphate reductoisomerase
MRRLSGIYIGTVVGGLVIMAENKRTVTVLGSTGSIGVNTLDVIARHPESFEVYALAAYSSVDTMLAQCLQFSPRYAVMMDESAATLLKQRLPEHLGTEVKQGEAGLEDIVTAPQVDVVMAAIVGAAGLPSALAAAQAGKTLLLANKESLVMGGHLLMQAVREAGARLLPIDSEHNAIFQCMPVDEEAKPTAKGVSKVILTASGGPFRRWSTAQMTEATPDQACAHPNWSMGRKISVDSASLMNKGLEFIEACWIFDLAPQRVEVVVHPQSIIHSMVQYLDGSVLAQLGNPDMRTAIAYGLGWPERLTSGVAPLDLVATARLDFEAPDEARFPCLRLAREAVAAGGTAMAVCNAANEVAVAGFLDEKIRFTDISAVIEHTLEKADFNEPTTVSVVKQADLQAREFAAAFLSDLQQPTGKVTRI